MRVIHASIGFGFLFPVKGCKVNLGLIRETLQKINSISAAITSIKVNNQAIQFRFSLFEDYHQKYGLKFGEPRTKESNGYYLHFNKAMVAQLIIGAYVDLDELDCLMLKREKLEIQEEKKEKRRSEIDENVKAVAQIAIYVIRQVGLPDFFIGDKCGERTDEVLAHMYDEILSMGKDVDGHNFTIHDRGECAYPLQRHLEFKNREA